MAVEGAGTARRQLTVLFSDLTESTRLVAELSPEDYADVLDAFKQQVELIIPQYGGTIVQVRGDGMLAMFGLLAREDESRYATEAALELHDAVKRISTPACPDLNLTMHSGIHSGLVLLIEGDSVYGKYVLAGDPPHIASRLSDQAQPDEILVSADSLGADLHFFDAEPQRKVRVKSVPEPIDVHAIVGRTNVHTRYEARQQLGQSTLVGRTDELKFLHDIYQKARVGALQDVSVHAPPGTGKTRLIEEFLASLEPDACVVLKGSCDRHLNVEALQPVRQMLLQFFDIDPRHGADEAEIGARLSALGGSSSPQEAGAVIAKFINRATFGEAELRDSLGQLCCGLAKQKTLIIFFDDWQWADDQVRRLDAALNEACTTFSIMVIKSSRDPRGLSGTKSTFDLAPLTTQHSNVLIEALLPDADPFLRDNIERAAGGNPLFLEELCHSVRGEDGRLGVQSGPEHPSNHLNMLLESRVANLPTAHASLVRAASVIGTTVPIWLLDAIIESDDLYAAIDTLIAQDLLVPVDDTSVRFKHGIARDVIYDSVGLHERRRYHKSIAEALEAQASATGGRPNPAQLAYHFGGAHVFGKAASYAEIAGDNAMAASALDRARLHYQAAMNAYGQLEQTDEVYTRWMTVARSLSMACLYDAEFSQLDVYHRALAMAQERQDLANDVAAEYQLAYINYALGEGIAALAHSSAAAEKVVHMKSTGFAIQVQASLAQTLALNGRYARALTEFDEALAKQRPHKDKPGTSFAFAYSLAARAMVLGDLGRFDEAHAGFNEANEIVDGPFHQLQTSVLAMQAAVFVWQGRWEDAIECAQRTMAIAKAIGSKYMYATSLVMIGYCEWQLDNSLGFDAMRRGIEWTERQEQALWTSLHYSWVAEALSSVGNREGTRHYAAQALVRARKGEIIGKSASYCAIAQLTDDPETRTRYFHAAHICADERQSRRESALTSLRQARAELERDAATDVDLVACQTALSEMGMFTYAARAQSLLRHP